MRPLGPTTNGSEKVFQFLSASAGRLGLGFEGAPVLAVVGGMSVSLGLIAEVLAARRR